MITKTSDISLSIKLPQHSWDEVDQIDIIFGQTIVIIHNSSYMQGFTKRAEETTLCKIMKNPQINPCTLCEDAFSLLKEKKFDSEEITEIIEEIAEKIQKLMKK